MLGVMGEAGVLGVDRDHCGWVEVALPGYPQLSFDVWV